MQLQQHALSALCPPMPDEDFASLVEDIKKNGQKEAVILLDGKVLDGWHRYRACLKVGVKCVTAKHDGSNALDFVLSRNLHRRHLTGSQRASLIVAANEWRERGRKPEPGSGSGKSEPGSGFPDLSLTTEQMAEAADVSTRTIEQAKVADRIGLGDAVLEGKVSVKAAAEVAKLPPKKREKAVAAIKAGKSIATPNAEPTALEKARCEIEELREALATAKDDIERLSAIEAGEQGDLIKRLQAELRAVKAKRDDVMRENNQLRAQIKILERQARKAA